MFKSRVVDARDGERAIIDDVLKADPNPKGRYRWVYAQLAKKLNKYIRKYKSLSAANELSDADYVIFFNVVEFRRILNTPYPYGELFVIVKGSPETLKPPRVVWRAQKSFVCRRRDQRSNQRPQSHSRRELSRKLCNSHPALRVRHVQLFSCFVH